MVLLLAHDFISHFCYFYYILLDYYALWDRKNEEQQVGGLGRGSREGKEVQLYEKGR